MPPKTDSTAIHSAASALWSAGFSVIPLKPMTKIPAVEWSKYTTTKCTVLELNAWWGGKVLNHFGLGIITGKVSHDVVLDFDPAKGSTVDQLLREAENHFKRKFPDTCRVRTVSKGRHDHYALSPATKSLKSALFFAGKHGRIELRADNAVAVMPPTMAVPKHSRPGTTGQYTYIRTIDQRLLWEDTWMAEIASRPYEDRHQSLGQRPTQAEIDVVLTTAYPYLDENARKILEGIIVPEDRSGQSYWLACELVRSGQTSPRAIATILLAAPYHQEKYGPRRSAWDDWKDACSCATRVLEEFNQAKAGAPKLGKVEIVAVNLASVVHEKPEFLVFPYLPRGEITDMSGNPGDGKSWIWMALSAGLTGSKICPTPYDNNAIKEAKILILTTEDDLHTTVAPRLAELGANMSLVTVVGKQLGQAPKDNYHNIESITAADLLAAEPHIVEIKPDLIVIDPLVLFATTAKGFDNDKAVQVRDLLNKLKAITREINCATLIVRHFRKQAASTAIYRGAGSIDFVGTARSALVVGRDKKTGVRALAHAKCNLAAKGPSLVFELSPDASPPFQWLGVDESIKAEHLTSEYAERQAAEAIETQAVLDAAVELLQDSLLAGPVPAVQIIKEAKTVQISEKSLYAAKSMMKLITKRVNGQAYWLTPEQLKTTKWRDVHAN